MTDKPSKTKGIFKKTLKSLILNFGREYYDENLQYAEKITSQWRKNIVRFIVDATINGFYFFIAIFAAVIVFPKLQEFIPLKYPLWFIPTVIFLLGVLLKFIQDNYVFFRKGYKGGKK